MIKHQCYERNLLVVPINKSKRKRTKIICYGLLYITLKWKETTRDGGRQGAVWAPACTNFLRILFIYYY
jgi:hypothetical protein